MALAHHRISHEVHDRVFLRVLIPVRSRLSSLTRAVTRFYTVQLPPYVPAQHAVPARTHLQLYWPWCTPTTQQHSIHAFKRIVPPSVHLHCWFMGHSVGHLPVGFESGKSL